MHIAYIAEVLVSIPFCTLCVLLHPFWKPFFIYINTLHMNIFIFMLQFLCSFCLACVLRLPPLILGLSGYRIQRWFFPYDYQIVQEIHRHEPESAGRSDLLEIENQLTPAEARRYAISLLPQERSKHTGFAFDSPGYESFFAAQLGIYAPQKAWDVARRASMKYRPKTPL